MPGLRPVPDRTRSRKTRPEAARIGHDRSMNASRLPLLISLAGAAVMLAAIVFVFGMVLLSFVTGDSLEFSGGHTEALAASFGVVA
jgi:hypothetical protein